MEKQLKFVLVLSLKEIALKRVAVLLWSDGDILTSISKFKDTMFHIDGSPKRWKYIIDKVKSKVSELELPKSLMKQITDIVYPIGLEIRRWKESHNDNLCMHIKLMNLSDWTNLYWTTAGTIDNKKTAENLVRCNALNINQRYQMARFYCLDDCIPHLWKELPAELKYHYQNEKNSFFSYGCCTHIHKANHYELYYWLQTWKNRNITPSDQLTFESSVVTGNKTAAEYFFQKMSHDEREVSLMRSANFVLAILVRTHFSEKFFSSVVCYLLFRMTPEQQMETIKAHPLKVSLCFLHSPLQDVFLQNASLIWACLPQSAYGDLLRRMTDKFMYSNYHCPKFFQEFFTQSPLDFKKCFIYQEYQFGDTPASHFLYIFFALEDLESIAVVFRNVDAADRVKLVFHRTVLKILYNLIASVRWHMVEVCLREATLSKENLERLKEALAGFCNRCRNGPHAFRNLMIFFRHLNEANMSSDKGEERLEAQGFENCFPE